MQKQCYIFYHKSDANCEPIGRVMATDLNDACIQISIIKQLSTELINDLFIIQLV
jgi:hypothetical protein